MEPLRLVTYNIHSCVGGDGLCDRGRIVRVLRELDADVLALQEVESLESHDVELLRHLAAQTGLQAVAGPTLLRENRHYGNALLTRLPILSTNRVDLTWRGREPRGALDMILDWDGRPLRLVATHLGLKPGERREQVRRLLSIFDADRSDHAVLLGDLNEWALWGRPLRWLRRHFAPTPHPRTYPARFPLLALDRIWARPRAALANVRTHDSPLARIASDHLPLKAELNSTQPG